MKNHKLSFFTFLLTILILPSCGDDGGSMMDDQQPTIDCSGVDPSYMTDVFPIIQATCARPDCHVEGFQNGNFLTYEGFKQQIDQGDVQRRAIELRDMPPDNTTGPQDLTEAQVKIIHCWIEDGAPNN